MNRSTLSSAFVATGLLAAAVLTGCAATVVDPKKAREAVLDDVERKTGVEIRRVSCPGDVEVEPGRRFVCDVFARDGREAAVRLRILNWDADVEITSIAPANG